MTTKVAVLTTKVLQKHYKNTTESLQNHYFDSESTLQYLYKITISSLQCLYKTENSDYLKFLRMFTGVQVRLAMFFLG